MGTAKKSQKKFQKNHLQTAIKKRKQHQKIGKWKAARAAPPKSLLAAAGESAATPMADGEEAKGLGDMDVDEFLSMGLGDDDADAEGTDDEEDERDLAGTDGESDVEVPQGYEEIDTSDDEEEQPQGSLRSNNKMLQGEAATHKQELEALKKKDPEFFQYLKEMDQELLQFDDSDAEEEGEAAPRAAKKATAKNGKAEEEEEQQQAEQPDASQKVLTTAMVQAWCTAAKEQHKLGAVRNLLRAFRSACHYGDAEALESAFNIGSSHVFNKVMVFVLREADGLFRTLLGVQGRTADAVVQTQTLIKRPRWKKLEPLIKSYLGNALHVLTQMTDAGMITFTLRRLGASADLLGPFERVQRKMLKAVLEVFGGGGDADNAQLRVAAILFIRRMAVAVPDSLDSCLRGVYRTYAANAKFMTVAGAPAISFMADCVVEMFGLDLTVSYQHMFVALRQLAVLLRSALTTKEKDAFRAVYCWQAVWCMEVWCRVLVTYADKEQLTPLVYPLVQIVLGAAKLLPAARYFPLRLRLVRLLNRLGGATGRFVPVSSLLLEVLQFKELNKAPMSEGKSRPPDFPTLLKVPKTVVRTPGFQNEVVFQAMELLAEHLAQWAYSPAFPELLHVPAAQLRLFAKATPVERFRKQARSLLDAAERHAEWVKAKRNAVDFAPKDQAAIAEFMGREREAQQGPLVKYAAQLRAAATQRQAVHRATGVATGKKGGGADGKKQGGKRGIGSDDDDDDEDNDGAAEAAFSGKWMPAKQKAATAKAPKRSAEESEGEQEEEGEEGEGDAGGHLEDIVMSDDSDDSDDEPPAAAPARPTPKAGGRKPGVKGKGGDKPKSRKK